VALRCVIVDDNAGFLQAAGTLLAREGLSVVGVASDGAQAVRQAQELRPDVVLVDVDLGGESGFDVARALERLDAGSPTVILISTHAEADLAELIAAAPAAGFVAKSDLSADAIARLAAR
jgi:DNA-binding NarL/FixJ family response regulator